MCGKSEYITAIEKKLWYANFMKLRCYFIRHEHTNISKSEDKSLYKWCKTQREAYQTDFKDPVKIEMLNRLDFDWNYVEQQEGVRSCFCLFKNKNAFTTNS